MPQAAAKQVKPATAAFGYHLSSADDTVQKALDTLDDAVRLRGFLNGARLAFASVASITIGTTSEESDARDSTDVLTMRWTGTLTASLASSGAAGLDTGTEAANTLYHVFVIGDTSGVNTPRAMISLSATAPTMPTGWDVFRRLGSIRNEGLNLLDFTQVWNGRTRRMYYDADRNDARVLNGASDTAFTDVDCSDYMPVTSRAGLIRVEFDNSNGSASDQLHIRENGSTILSPLIRLAPGAILAEVMEAMLTFVTDAAQVFEYVVDDAGDEATISIIAYDDEL